MKKHMTAVVPAPVKMTLRDYFAGQVLAGMAFRTNFSVHWAAEISVNAYQLADAMLAAREANDK